MTMSRISEPVVSKDSPKSMEDTDVTRTSMRDENIVMQCVLNSDRALLISCFEDETSEYRGIIEELLDEHGEQGKTPLEMAAILGRAEIMAELLLRGVDINSVSTSGYSALHLAACWGQISILKVLVAQGIDLDLRTKHSERARDIAMRYNQSECVDYLDWADSRQALINAVSEMKEVLQDPEKHQGRLTREDKATVLSACNEKTDFVENSTEATTQDFILQKQVLQEMLAPILAKLTTEPAAS